MASFDASLLDDTAPRSARIVALGLLADVAAERQRLQAERGSETLHDFRVSMRRLRSWLRALGPQLAGSVPDAVRRRLRRIARESNVGRDAEVFLGWLTRSAEGLSPREQAAVRWLRMRFERQQQEADSGLEQRLARDFDRVRSRLENRLTTYRVEAHVHAGVREQVFATVMARLILQHAEELKRRLRRVHTVDDIDQAHQARIAGKRLRYLLEPIAPHTALGTALVEQLKGLQDILGDLHDAHLWLMVLRDVVSELAIEDGRRMARSFSPASEVPQGAARRRGPARTGFVSLARLAQERSAASFDKFVAAWSESTSKRFFRDVNKLARELKAHAPRNLEIERKYLLSALPLEMPDATTVSIDQGYIPGDRVVERLRVVRDGKGQRFYRTIKVGSGVVRTELEDETTCEIHEAMWPLTQGRRLTKRRHNVPAGSLTWEVDEFTDRDLVLAEIELPAADTKVEYPAWLAPYVVREVTGEPEYLNSVLAR
jgi:CHAD domain-containing protein/CYTH domain-containing protein